MKIPRQFRFALALGVAAAISVFAGCKNERDPHSEVLDEPLPAKTLPARPMDRLEWNLLTLVEAYRNAGFTNAAWDEPATNALDAFARIRSFGPGPDEFRGRSEVIAEKTHQSVEAGCKDPMIAYLHLRYCRQHTYPGRAYADAMRDVAIAMNQSSYPVIRKFYCSRRAFQEFLRAYPRGSNRDRMREVGDMGFFALAVLRDPLVPKDEAFDVFEESYEGYEGNRSIEEFNRIVAALEEPVFEKWPDDHRIWLFRGKANIRRAWLARGSGYANTVTEEGWKDFNRHLLEAEKALARAWELNQTDNRIPIAMLTVELGQGKGRERMELWFERAMNIDSNSFDACNAKLYYLEPKWHGSPGEMIEFGYECLDRWGPSVRLILINAHERLLAYAEGEEATNYWKSPDVWVDVQAAYESFFRDNPTATGWYHNYARMAWRAEQWTKLNELLPKLGPINYSFFGGTNEFEKMANLARERARPDEPDVMSAEVDLKRLLMRAGRKFEAETVTEDSIANELSQLDSLASKYPNAGNAYLAKLLFTKAGIYLGVLNDLDKARAVIAELKSKYPATSHANEADAMLTRFEQSAEARKIQSQLALGNQFPDFQETDLAGKPLSIANLKGKVVLIDFWATWCGPCIAELPNVLAAYEKHHGRGFEIVGISLDDDKAKLETFIRQRKMTWPQFFDGAGWENRLAQKYGIESIPATFLLDRQGKIIAKDLRGEELEKAVAAALALPDGR